MKLAAITASFLLLGSTAAFAQAAPDATTPPADATQPGSDPAAPAPTTSDPTTTAANPATGAATAAPTSFSQDQIDGFGQAYVKIQDVTADTTMDQSQKQTAMVQAVTESGIDPQTFNAIAEKMQSDPALHEKVQLAVANAQGSTSNQ